MDIKILVATHKKYWMPADDVYLPIHVGREGKEDLDYMGDNTGDNISEKIRIIASLQDCTGLGKIWIANISVCVIIVGILHIKLKVTA